MKSLFEREFALPSETSHGTSGLLLLPFSNSMTCRAGRINTFKAFLVEVRLHQLDAEVPLNLKNELKNVDGIDFEFSTDAAADRRADPRALSR